MNFIKILILLCFGLSSTDAFAQRQKKNQKADNQVTAKRCIRRTAVVLKKAQAQVKENKNYTGKLALAVRHQRLARKYYKNRSYGKAIQQSRLSRRLAFAAIKDNKGTVDAKDDFNTDENVPAKTPSDEELTKELPEEKITDQELITDELTEIDLTEDE
jgi:hypothetical protein